jgi:hypothetical protein
MAGDVSRPANAPAPAPTTNAPRPTRPSRLRLVKRLVDERAARSTKSSIERDRLKGTPHCEGGQPQVGGPHGRVKCVVQVPEWECELEEASLKTRSAFAAV